MRKLAILTFVTLDGVMQGPSAAEEDRSDGFALGGWAKPYWDEVMAQVQTHAMAEPYDFLFGGNTFDMFSAHWPKEDQSDPAAKAINGSQKYVVTSREEPLGWSYAHKVQGDDIPGEIAKLKAEDGKLLQVHGSCALIQLLLKHDLVDELRLWTFPTILGSGRQLFSGGTVPAQFELTKAEPTPNGVLMSLYKRAR